MYTPDRAATPSERPQQASLSPLSTPQVNRYPALMALRVLVGLIPPLYTSPQQEKLSALVMAQLWLAPALTALCVPVGAVVWP